MTKELFPETIGLLEGKPSVPDDIEVDVHRIEKTSTPLMPGYKKKDGIVGLPNYRVVCANVGAAAHREIQRLALCIPKRPASGWIKSLFEDYSPEYEEKYNEMLVAIAAAAQPHITPREGKGAAIISERGVRFKFDQALEMDQTRWLLTDKKLNPHVALEAARGSFDENGKFQPDPDLPSLANARPITGRNKYTGKKRSDLLPQEARLDLAILEYDPKNEELAAALQAFGKIRESMNLRKFTKREWWVYNTIREAFTKTSLTEEEIKSGKVDESLRFRFVNIKTHLLRGQDVRDLFPTNAEIENTIKHCNALEHFFRQITPPEQRDEFRQALYKNAEVGLLKVNIELVSRSGRFSMPHTDPSVYYHPLNSGQLRRQAKRDYLEKAKGYRERTKPNAEQSRNQEPVTVFEEQPKELAREVGALEIVI